MNMVSQDSSTTVPTDTTSGSNIDAFALFEALTGRKIKRNSMSVDDYIDLHDDDDVDTVSGGPIAINSNTHGGRMSDRDRERERERERDRERERERERQRERENSRERHGGRNRSRDREREMSGREPHPDSKPKDSEINVGCINPFALAEVLIGRRIDRRSLASAKIISDVLQTDYDELFDMKHDSVLYAGLRLNQHERNAQRISESEMKILNERDLVTPDLSRVDRLEDLERIGLKDLKQARVKMARMENGKLRLVVDAPRSLSRTVTNREVTNTVNRLALPFRKRDEEGDRSQGDRAANRDEGRHSLRPPNSAWRDMFEVYMHNNYERTIERVNEFQIGRSGFMACSTKNRFDDPCQGACGNSWLVAAIFSVFWSDPAAINRATRAARHENGGNRDQRRRVLSVRFHDKGGRNNSSTGTVDVNYEILVNNSSNDPLYCRSGDNTEIWPSLYEKAFAKWITNTNDEHPDITQTAHGGDPVKAMAQINNREPEYWECEKHSPAALMSIVRNNSVNHRTINPMSAWTYATAKNHVFRGANLVANHAYSVLGWAGNRGDRQYVVLRNPWGVTEPMGMNSYPGLIERVEPELWRPACLLDRQGVIAMEANAFRECFSHIGVAR